MFHGEIVLFLRRIQLWRSRLWFTGPGDPATNVWYGVQKKVSFIGMLTNTILVKKNQEFSDFTRISADSD